MGRPVDSFTLAMVGMAPANTASASVTHTHTRRINQGKRFILIGWQILGFRFVIVNKKLSTAAPQHQLSHHSQRLQHLDASI